MTGNHPAALLRRLNPYCARALDAAASLCQTRAHAEITIEHWLLKLLEQGEGDITVIARRYEWDIDTLWQSLLAHLDTLPRSVRERPQLSEPLTALIRQAWLIASLEGDDPQIRSQHLLMALTEKPMLPACNDLWVLLSLSRVQLERLRPLLDAQSDECPARQPQVTEPLTSAQPGVATTDAPANTLTGKQDDALLAVLNRFTEDVTEKARSGRIDPVFGRDTEIRQMVDILSRRRKNNPILVGEPGVGKTALVEGLALRIAEGNVPDSLKTVHIRTLDLGLLQAGAGVKGEFEQRLKNVIDAVQKSPEPVLLFIDEAHTIIGAGNQAGGADAANLLKPALARGELRTIAATTWSEYKQYFERDAALERRFQMVKVDEPDDDTACLMLRGLKARYAQHHGVHMLDSAIQTAVRLSRRYLTGRQLPDKAVDLLDTAGARVRMSLDTLPEPLTQLHARLAALDIEREAIEQDSVFYPEASPERLAELIDLRDELQAEAGHLETQYQQEKRLAQQIMTLRQEGTDSTELQQQLRTHQGFAPLLALDVDARAVATVVADWTGIPLSVQAQNDLMELLAQKSIEITSTGRLSEIISRLFIDIRPQLFLLPPDFHINVLLEIDAPLSGASVRTIWQDEWQKAGLPEARLFSAPEPGLAAVDDWLDNFIQEKAVLLVISVRLEPKNPERTAESATALLLANRLTQTALTPQALLHRPECITDAEMMTSGIAQALDWMPVQPDAISGMWTAELDREQRTALLFLNQSFTQEALMYELDAFLGRSGPAAPWLSVAAAALAAVHLQQPQLTLSGVQGGHYSWATVVSPFVSPQEAS